MIQVCSQLFRTLYRNRRFIYVTSIPKSGSTFLANALSEVTGYPLVRLCFGFERHEQDLYLPRLVDACRRNTVTRHHMRATKFNTALLKEFNIKPVILTRNLFDVVPSLRDQLFSEGFEKMPGIYCTERFADLSEESQLDFIIDMFLPWCVHFYVSWFDTWKNNELPMLWLRFEDVVKDWPTSVGKVLEFYGVAKSNAEIKDAIERTYQLDRTVTRFSSAKGNRKGRLSEEQKERIARVVRFYPWVDFSPLGLQTARETRTLTSGEEHDVAADRPTTTYDSTLPAQRCFE
jgi:hypothetical protein